MTEKMSVVNVCNSLHSQMSVVNVCNILHSPELRCRMTVTLTLRRKKFLSPKTRKPASSQCSDITKVTSPAGFQADYAVTSGSHEEEHKHLIKNLSERCQAERPTVRPTLAG